MTRGHVPEELIGPYREWRELSRQADSLGCVLSGLGKHGLANSMWEAERILKERANSYRVEFKGDDS